MLNKINTAVTGNCKGPLGHQVEQPPINFYIKVLFFAWNDNF